MLFFPEAEGEIFHAILPSYLDLFLFPFLFTPTTYYLW